MSIQYQNHGIFCLEGHWERNLKDKSSVRPLLELFQLRGVCNFIYHQCATTEEFEFYIEKWKQSSYRPKFPILYLGFHGDADVLYVDSRRGKKPYTLSMLGDILGGSGDNAIIYFASCGTLAVNKRKINTFLKKTHFLATLGYLEDVDWIRSAAMDLLILDALQIEKFDTQGINKISDYLLKNTGTLQKTLSLRFVKNASHFPRKRVVKA
jgi:hypothetical protein